MLMTKWIDTVTSSWMRDNFCFGVGLVGAPLLVPDVPKLSGTGALGLLVVVIMRQAGYGGMGMEMAGEAVRSSELG